MTFVRMSLEDKLAIVKINKQDRELNKQEDFDNLSSYKTESIKSEGAYEFKMEACPCENMNDDLVRVFKSDHRIFI